MSRLFTTTRNIFRQPGFAGLLATCFVLGLAHAFVQPFLSLWGEQQVGLDKWNYGLFMAVTTLSGVVLNTLFARWSDTIMTRRTVLLIGAAGGTIGYLGYAFVSNLAALYIIGATAVGVSMVNFSQLFAHVSEELQRPGYDPVVAPFLMSVLRVFFSFAWIGGPAVAGSIMTAYDFRELFLAATVVYVLFTGGVLLFVHRRPRTPAANRAAQAPLFKVLTRPDILIYFIGFTFVFTTHTLAWNVLPLLVTHELGGTERDVAVLFGIAPAIELPLMLWFGKLATGGRQRGLIQIGVAVNVLYFVALSFAQAPWHVFPCQILSAIAVAITTNITITFFQDLLPGQAGVATSLFGNAYSVGMVLAYMIVMGWGDLLGHRGLFHLSGVLVATALLTFLVRARRTDNAVAAVPAEV
jgi:SET family sugar efflux transporter-like MFS transporter